MAVEKKKLKVVNNKTHSIDGLGLMQGKGSYTDDLAAQNSLVIKILPGTISREEPSAESCSNNTLKDASAQSRS